MSHPRFQLLEELRSVPWPLLARAYGNSHPTMIGILTRWWLERSPGINWVLDGAPSYAVGNKGRCDAVLCDREGPAGVLEVEGSYQVGTARKIGKYFATRRKELTGIRFGILVLYTYVPKGSGAARAFPALQDPTVLEVARQLTVQHSGTELVVLKVDRSFEYLSSGIRSTRDYYKGSLRMVEGISYSSGKERGRETYFSADGV